MGDRTVVWTFRRLADASRLFERIVGVARHGRNVRNIAGSIRCRGSVARWALNRGSHSEDPGELVVLGRSDLGACRRDCDKHRQNSICRDYRSSSDPHYRCFFDHDVGSIAAQVQRPAAKLVTLTKDR